MTWPAVKFVDAPEPTADVRLDLSTPDVQVLADGFSLGAPSFNGDSRTFGVDYGDRSLTMSVSVMGTKTETLAVLQLLAREVVRQQNWLLFQLDPTQPAVWYKTWRAQPGDLSFDNVYDGTTGDVIPDRWVITVPLTAEAFAYGERVTLPAVTINNNAAAGTNPCSYVLPTIKGDAPAPLRIAADFSATLNQYDILWSTSPVPSTYTAPIVWPIGSGDGLTAGTDTGAAVTDSAFSGGSYRSVSFSTVSSMATRLQGVAPAVVPAGRYMVFLRFARSDTTSTFAFKFGYNDLGGVDVAGSETVIMDRAASTTAGYATWVPLGTFSFPRYANDLVISAFDFAPSWALQAQRLSGTGAAQLDAIMLIPADLRGMGDAARTLISQFHGFGPQSVDVASYWDGDLEAYTRVNAFAVLDSSIQPLAMQGGFPQVYPGQRNMLHLLQQTKADSGYFGVTDNPDAIATSAVVTLSYHPRYLYLRGD